MSPFHIRYNCLQLTKVADEDYTAYAGRVNLRIERFKLNVLSSDQVKCLLLTSGLNSPVDADFLMRLLSRMELDNEMTLKTVTVERQRLMQYEARPVDGVKQARSTRLEVKNTGNFIGLRLETVEEITLQRTDATHDLSSES